MMKACLFLVCLITFAAAVTVPIGVVSAGYAGTGLIAGVGSGALYHNLIFHPAESRVYLSGEPVITVLATKSPSVRNITGTSLFNQGSSVQAKPIAAPGFRESSTLITPLMTSATQQNTLPQVKPLTNNIVPMTTPAPVKFPIPTTGTPLLKTGTLTTGQSSLPKVPFPSLNSIPSQPAQQTTTPTYVDNSTRTIEQRIFYYTNVERTKAGKSLYVYDSRLSDIARDDAVDMATRNFFDHTNPDGQSPTDRAKAHGYPIEKDYGTYYRIGVGENIAEVQNIQGPPDEIAQFIVNAWMNSPDHRENILDLNGADYTNLGVGVAYDAVNDKYLAVQEFF